MRQIVAHPDDTDMRAIHFAFVQIHCVLSGKPITTGPVTNHLLQSKYNVCKHRQGTPMQIDFYYYEDCPSHEDALARLQAALADAGIADEIHIMKVETEEQAERYAFVGSPTIRLNGADVVPPPENAPYALTCRVYQHDDGRYSSMPSMQQIARAIRVAAEA